MLSIKARIKIKELKRKLISIWYFLMKPLAYLIDKIDNYKYNKSQDKISKWTDEYAVKLYSKILVKQLIKYKNKYEEFVVAEWCNEEDGLRTIKDYIISQRYNRKLESWSYKLPYSDVDRIEKLTELLRIELEKYKEINCEYITDKKYSYCGLSRNYRKTLAVKLNL